jgi:hypothetical protein
MKLYSMELKITIYYSYKKLNINVTWVGFRKLNLSFININRLHLIYIFKYYYVYNRNFCVMSTNFTGMGDKTATFILLSSITYSHFKNTPYNLINSTCKTSIMYYKKVVGGSTITYKKFKLNFLY